MKTNMLLIIFLGLIAALTSVSGDCDYGTSDVVDFDWNKFSGPRLWYCLLHNSNDSENDNDCPVVTFASPTGKWSLVTTDIYEISEQRRVIQNGNATNWNNTGYFEVYHPVSLWNGHVYIIAIDYDRYVIFKICPFGSNKTSVYVAFRSLHPDESTVKEVLKELQVNNIDVNQLVKFKTDHCQRAESSTEGGTYA